MQASDYEFAVSDTEDGVCACLQRAGYFSANGHLADDYGEEDDGGVFRNNKCDELSLEEVMENTWVAIDQMTKAEMTDKLSQAGFIHNVECERWLNELGIS